MEKTGQMGKEMGQAFDGKASRKETLPKERESAGQAVGAEERSGGGAKAEETRGVRTVAEGTRGVRTVTEGTGGAGTVAEGTRGTGTVAEGTRGAGTAVMLADSGEPVTREELGELYFLQSEIEGLRRRIRELRNTLKSPALSGMPRGGGVSDPVARTAELIEQQEGLLIRSVEKCLEQQNRLLEFIEGVGDARIRLILRYRHLEGLNWVQVAHRMSVTPESVKMAYKRFFDGREGIQ